MFILKRGTRSVENPFGFWIRRGECISVAPSARPNFGSKIRFRFLAVYFKNSSNGILPSPRGARLGCGGGKNAGSPPTPPTPQKTQKKKNPHPIFFFKNFFLFWPKRPFQILAGRRVSRRELTSSHLHFPNWRYSLYKIRTFFESNPDEE